MIYNSIEKGIKLVILFCGEIMLSLLQKHLRLEHSHGRHKILFTARLLPFRFRLEERYSVVTARHEEPSTFPFIIASSILSHFYETISNFVQRYNALYL